jgi:hypothetical protein
VQEFAYGSRCFLLWNEVTHLVKSTINSFSS